jgi:O-antigen/teichoic acid export membrane protein
MTSALIQKKSSDRLDYSTILTFNMVMGCVLYILLFLTSNMIEKWFEIPDLASIIRVLGLQIIIGSINSVQIAYVQKNMNILLIFSRLNR